MSDQAAFWLSLLVLGLMVVAFVVIDHLHAAWAWKTAVEETNARLGTDDRPPRQS